MKLYMFRTVPLSVIRSSFTVHSAMVCVIQVCRQLSSRTRLELHPGPARKLSTKLYDIYHILISQIYFGMRLYMFRTVPLSIIRSLFTVHSPMVYVIRVCRQLSSRTRILHPDPSRKLSTNVYDVYHCRVHSE